jgi:hypothetical protein
MSESKTHVSAAAPWPPPPDIESIKELVRDADVEGFIVDGAPADEYDTEAEELHAAIAQLPSEAITVERLMPVLEAIWRKNLVDDDAELAERRPALEGLAGRIARFFGPEAKPQTRGQ